MARDYKAKRDRDRERRASAILHAWCWHARRRIMPQSTTTCAFRKVSRVAHAVDHRSTRALVLPMQSQHARVRTGVGAPLGGTSLPKHGGAGAG
ncbi:hypothetical protein OAO87_02575 [bacterium]|nr:hypothetical protein [bacterium]